MKDKIQPRIENGEFSILIAPSQSGKTSFVRNTLMPSLIQVGYLPLFVDMRGVVSAYKSSSKTFIDCVILAIFRNIGGLRTSGEKPTSLLPLFKVNDGDNSYFGANQKVVLIFDEIDSIAELTTEERNDFLTALSTMKHNKELYCLHSCLSITNCIGEYFYQTTTITIGNSPFNVTNPIDGDYFNEQEIELFFNEFEKERGKQISNEIRNNIYKLTTGAQGQTVMLTVYYERLCGKDESIDEKYWVESMVSQRFWGYISQHQNFMRIKSIGKDEKIAKSLLDWFNNKKQPTCEDIINTTLIKSNILKRNLTFASPLIEQYVIDRLITNDVKCGEHL